MKFKAFKDPVYHVVPYFSIIRTIIFARHPDDKIRHVVLVSLLLRFFYAWMIIYTPLYLNKYVGFDWSEISIIFTIMLLPFVLFEIPAGYLADKKTGEGRIAETGFFIMSFFTIALFFISEPSVALWAGLLFLTRVGASFVEIASESYFFKHIQSADAELLSVFRNAQSIASIIAPLIASFFLIFLSMDYLFLALGIFMVYGIYISQGMSNKGSPT